MGNFDEYKKILSDNCLHELFTYPCVNAFSYCQCFPVLFF